MHNKLAWSLIVGFIAVLVWLRTAHPFYNWDVVPYVGAALAYDGESMVSVHAEVYRLLDGLLPPAPPGHFQAMVRDDSAIFAKLLPFYTIKPLYVGLIYSAAKLGISPVAAALSISTLAVIGTCLVVFLWLRIYLTPLLSASSTIALALAAHLSTLATVATPDALSLLLMVLALYLWLEKNWAGVGAVLLVISLAARLNNVLFIGLLYGLLLVRGHANTARVTYLLGIFASVTVYLLIQRSAGGYPWWTLFQHTFIDFLTQPDSFAVPFCLSCYGDVLAHNSLQLLTQSMSLASSLYAFVLLSVLVFSHTQQRLFIVAIWLSMAAHYLLFPQNDGIDRFFAPYYVLITVFAAQAFSTNRHHPK